MCLTFIALEIVKHSEWASLKLCENKILCFLPFLSIFSVYVQIFYLKFALGERWESRIQVLSLLMLFSYFIYSTNNLSVCRSEATYPSCPVDLLL